MKRIELKGERFGKLKVIRIAPGHAVERVKWMCLCDCGRFKEVRANDLLRGATKSCGCLKTRNGEDHPLWKIGLRAGYERVNVNGERTHGHRIVIEEVLGKLFPNNAVTHHIDENRQNNNKNNLVLCEDRNYHNLLHKRITARRECGHASWMKCPYCKEYDDPKNMYVRLDRRQARHIECHREYMKDYKEKIRGYSA